MIAEYTPRLDLRDVRARPDWPLLRRLGGGELLVQIGGKAVTLHVQLVKEDVGWRVRTWFRCSGCGCKRRVLFLDGNRERLACRRCLGLVYYQASLPRNRFRREVARPVLRAQREAEKRAKHSHKPPGGVSRLTEEQRNELVTLIEAGPQACGYGGGVWTGPRIGHLIEEHFGVHFHPGHVPRLLHRLGFSVQRPPKRLARADAQAQEYWLREQPPG